MPKRIQLKRTKGWRMPDGAVKVDRTTRWGNPFRLKNGAESAQAFRAHVENFGDFESGRWDRRQTSTIADIKQHLGGKDLACWCPLDQPCHVDVLLDLANRED